MADHDPYCLMDTAHRLCICISLRMARDDQGERIAQKMEATGHAIPCATRYNGPMAPDVYGCDCGLERHLRIARGGGSDG